MVLTKRQHDVLQFIREFQKARGFCPSFAEIAEGVALSSLATVHAHVAALKKKGFIQRGFNQGRAIRLRKPRARRARAAAAGTVPLLGRIAAGAPVEAIAGRDDLSLADVTGRKDVFALEVRGDSMIEEHIMDGDYVLVEKRDQADNGSIVVALVDGNEATLKRLYREKGGMVRLQPANARLQPLRLAAQRVRVQGRVIGVLRKY